MKATPSVTVYVRVCEEQCKRPWQRLQGALGHPELTGMADLHRGRTRPCLLNYPFVRRVVVICGAVC